jgi:CheY-like chemotaxis protein
MDREGQGPGRTKRILLVDDDPLGRKLAALRLRGAGFEVDTASTAEEALLMAAAAPPDAILSDIRMPGKDGFQLCQAIRGNARLAHAPVLLLSAVAVEEREHRRAADMKATCLLRTSDLREAIAALAVAFGEAD